MPAAAAEEEIVEVQPLRSSSLSIGSSFSPLPAAVPRSQSSATVLLRSLSRHSQNGAKYASNDAEKGMPGKEEDSKDCEVRRIESSVSNLAVDGRSQDGVIYEKHADDAHTGKRKARDVRRRNVGMWRSSLVELIATLVLTFVSIAAVIACLRADFNFPRIAVATTQFLIYTMCIVAVAPLSGAHLNPSFSFTCILTGHISALHGVLYILAQSIGSILGALFVRAAVPSDTAQMYYLGGCLLKQQVLVDTNLNAVASVGPDSGPALVAELFFSFLLIAVALPILIFPLCQAPKHAFPGQPMLSQFLSFPDPGLLRAAFITGLLLGLLIFVSGQLLSPGYTSAGMNPARCFGPAVAQGGAALWKPQWVFWLGPFLAAALFALLYRVVCFSHPWRMTPYGPDQWQDHGALATLPLVSTSKNSNSIAAESKTILPVDDRLQRSTIVPLPYTPDPKDPTSRRMDVFLHIKATMQKPEQLESRMDEHGRCISTLSGCKNEALADPAAVFQDQQYVFLEQANLSLRNLMEIPSTSSNTITSALKLEELLKDTDEL